MFTLRTIPKIRIRNFSMKRELELTNKMLEFYKEKDKEKDEFSKEKDEFSKAKDEFSKAKDEFFKAKDAFSEARVEMVEKMYQKEREIVIFLKINLQL